MSTARTPNPHLRLTAAILVAVLAALAGGFASDGSDPRARRAELQSTLRLVVVADDVRAGSLADASRSLARLGEAHGAQAALVASDTSSVRAEQSIRRIAAHARTALLKTSALPPPLA
jgi:hypothetical protein